MEIIALIGIIWVLYAWIRKDSNPDRTRGPARSDGTLPPVSDVHKRTRVDSPPRQARGANAALIKKAIDQSKSLRFSYVDQDGEITHRTVIPNYLEHRHDVLCLVAYCHLRNANRTFVVRRMQHLSLQ